MHSVLIVNPRASKVTEPLVAEVARTLGVADVPRTERSGHATELAAGAADADRIYVFSGDGGFNEALNGSDGRIPLGFVPGGGTSVLPRVLGLPRDPVEAARRLAAGTTRRISLGRANGRRFGFAAGVGLDAELVRRMDARGRDETGRRPGDLVFAWTAVKTLAETPAPLRAGARDRGTRTRRLRPRRQLGSLHLRRPVAAAAPARRQDRRGPRPACAAFLPARSLPGALSYILTGRTRLSLLHLHDADRIQIRCDVPMPLQLDGEDIGDVIEVVLEAERDAVSVLV